MAATVTNSVSSLVQAIGEIPPEGIVFGQSEAMQALRDRMAKVASANVPVLIHGESGTGKDIIARLVHALSPWKSGKSELPRHSGHAVGKRTVRL
jgi:DNA-binding NtrC family response regulator